MLSRSAIWYLKISRDHTKIKLDFGFPQMMIAFWHVQLNVQSFYFHAVNFSLFRAQNTNANNFHESLTNWCYYVTFNLNVQTLRKARRNFYLIQFTEMLPKIFITNCFSMKWNPLKCKFVRNWINWNPFVRSDDQIIYTKGRLFGNWISFVVSN